jgi:hypothetical protein
VLACVRQLPAWLPDASAHCCQACARPFGAAGRRSTHTPVIDQLIDHGLFDHGLDALFD